MVNPLNRELLKESPLFEKRHTSKIPDSYDWNQCLKQKSEPHVFHDSVTGTPID